MKQNSTIKKRMKWRVQKRDQNDKSRFEEFFAYDGPDFGTLKLLEEQYEKWMKCPILFWHDSGFEKPGSEIIDPEAHVVECYMRPKRDGL